MNGLVKKKIATKPFSGKTKSSTNIPEKSKIKQERFWWAHFQRKNTSFEK
ncbi:hypothetical protein NPIL_236001, partial [Nephila pilipes]